MKTRGESIARLRIELSGDLWGHDALSLADRLPLSELTGVKCVVLSLDKVRQIDQAGLAMLVRLYSHLRIRGTELQLIDVPATVHEPLQRVGFTKLVSCVSQIDRAVAHETIAMGAHVEA